VQSRRFVIVTIIALLLTTGGVLAAAAFAAAQAFLNSCSLASLKPVSIGENSFVYAADGSLLGSIPAEQNRQPIALDQMSPLLAQATVAIEDRRFYSHDGVDYEGIVRAAVKNMQEGEIVQGGSTLTQQLVRNLYIGQEVSWSGRRRGLPRHQARGGGPPDHVGVVPPGLTPAEVKAWRKDRILETYLNQVYFGACLRRGGRRPDYFSKHVELELAERR
jgi:membrane peptidoglycan carboxypeptidase